MENAGEQQKNKIATIGPASISLSTFTSGSTLPKRILMITWEYPPRVIGGISRVVEGLSKSLTRLGIQVHVITTEMPGSPKEEIDEGVYIHRVSVESPAPNFHSWVLLMNHYFSKRAGKLAREVGRFDIVHIHDWLTLPCGVEVKDFLGCSMVSTLHSLEFKRAGGISSNEGRMIDSFEWWITFESSLVIVCSGSMKEDTRSKFNVPEAKVWVIPIGIEPKKFGLLPPRLPNGISSSPATVASISDDSAGKHNLTESQKNTIRAKFGVQPHEKLVLFIGRLTHQKGCEYLIRAIPSAAKFHNVKLVIVGDGYQRGELEYGASLTGEAWRIRFTGFISDGEVTDLLKSADVMVIPSVYEPFGVVALEAMAAGLPVVASDVDGLGEIIKHEYNGILVYPRDSSSISWGISRILSDSTNTTRMVENAREDVIRKYSWSAVATLTLEAYRNAMK